MDESEFFSAVCRGLGWEPSDWRLSVFGEWHRHEGMPWWTWNPLATTRLSAATPLSSQDVGYGPGNWNSVPVRIYATAEAGVQATVETLALPYYMNVRRCFADETGYADAVPELATYVGSWAYGQALVDYMRSVEVADPRVDTVLHTLQASGIQQWADNGNEPIIQTIAKMADHLASIDQTLQQLAPVISGWPGIEQQTYGTNTLLHSWRAALAGNGIIVP